MSNKMTQIKFTINSEIANSFKAQCKSEGVSMASVVSRLLESSQPSKPLKIRTQTRPFRRMAVRRIIELLEEIIDREQEYRDAIPEQFASRCEKADETCESLLQAISCLEDAYQ